MNIFTKLPIHVGDERIVYTEKKPKVGTRVSIFSKLGNFLAVKPVASGVVVSNCADEKEAPITPSSHGKKANAWKNLYRIRVTKIKNIKE